MFYTLEITENSKLVCYSVQQNRLNCINEVVYFMTENGYKPAENSTICITMKEHYFDQCGKKQTKYKKGKFSFFKYFTCCAEQFSIELIHTDMVIQFWTNIK